MVSRGAGGLDGALLLTTKRDVAWAVHAYTGRGSLRALAVEEIGPLGLLEFGDQTG